MVPVALILVIAIVTLYVARSIRTFSALKHFGGPRSTGWSRLWLLRTQSSGEMNKRFTVVTNKYGELNYPVRRNQCLSTDRDLPSKVTLQTYRRQMTLTTWIAPTPVGLVALVAFG